jgi:membrane-bound metal-dependent hydrolase YbcI (DUF457 family)
MLMPFTPFHLGPAFGLGLPFRRYLHVPTFMLANVILDVEPFLVLVLGLRYPLHGYFHTFLLALFVGLGVGCIMFLLEKFLHGFFRGLLLEPNGKLSLNSFMAAGVLGTALHVLLDAPLYGEMQPFYPLTVNPLYAPSLSPTIYNICVWLGIIGVIYYLYLLVLRGYMHFHSKAQQQI